MFISSFCYIAYRFLLTALIREKGLIGDLEISYSSYYLLPGEKKVSEAMPGVLNEGSGKLKMYQGESKLLNQLFNRCTLF